LFFCFFVFFREDIKQSNSTTNTLNIGFSFVYVGQGKQFMLILAIIEF